MTRTRPSPDDPPGRPLVRAAGGVVVRPAGDAVLVLVVHRPRYDDWSFPKGKLDPGETFEDAAVREVLEESGVRVALGADLGWAEYVDHRGRPKRVRYWVMTEVGADAFVPNDEVDEVAWVSIDDARERLTYEFDRSLLDGLEARLPSP